MILRPPRSTRTDTLFPYTTLFRSISIISHDLRLPLSSMLMLGEGGMVDRMTDSQRQYVFDQVSQNARTSLQAMDGLVHWMKLNTVGLAYTPSTVNLKEVILAALEIGRAHV